MNAVIDNRVEGFMRLVDACKTGRTKDRMLVRAEVDSLFQQIDRLKARVETLEAKPDEIAELKRLQGENAEQKKIIHNLSERKTADEPPERDDPRSGLEDS